MRVLIVLPTYNEAPNILDLLRKISAVRGFFPGVLDVYVIDDNSPDGTGEIAYKYSLSSRWVRVRIRRCKLGLASALLDGFRYAYLAGYDYVVSMDADLQHNPFYIINMVRRAREGFDVVIGSRYVVGGNIAGWSLVRRIVSLFANLYAKILLGLNQHDVTSGFKVYSRRAVAAILSSGVYSRGYAVQPETLYIVRRFGLRIGEEPFIFVSRERGRSKLSIDIIVEYFFMVPRLVSIHSK